MKHLIICFVEGWIFGAIIGIQIWMSTKDISLATSAGLLCVLLGFLGGTIALAASSPRRS